MFAAFGIGFYLFRLLILHNCYFLLTIALKRLLPRKRVTCSFRYIFFVFSIARNVMYIGMDGLLEWVRKKCAEI